MDGLVNLEFYKEGTKMKDFIKEIEKALPYKEQWNADELRKARPDLINGLIIKQ